MLKCPFCKKQTARGEPTGKLVTLIKVEYSNGTIGNRILKEVKCCINCSGMKMLKEIEKVGEKIK